jgi:hypothetical protein
MALTLGLASVLSPDWALLCQSWESEWARLLASESEWAALPELALEWAALPELALEWA